MNKLLLFIASVIGLSSVAQAQTWEKLFSKKNTDAFRQAIEVPTGGYIAVGYTSNFTPNDTDAYIVRLNTAGDTLWTRTINGTASRKDLLYKVINTSDGGFAFCGYSTSFGNGSEDAYIVKTDGNGNILWQKTWGGNARERAQEILETSDGGLAICGYTTSPPAQYFDGFIVRMNATGDTLWSRRYGTSQFEDFNSFKQIPGGGFIACGQATNGANALDIYLVKTTANGDTVWTKRFGTTGTDNADYIIALNNGYVLAGGTDGISGGMDGYFIKTDSNGNVLWTKVYGGNALADDFHQVGETTDGGFILSGTTSTTGPIDPNIWIMKTDANGDSLWSRTYGGNNHDHGYSAVETSDGGYIVSGYSSSFGFNYEEAYIIKADANGDLSNYLTYTTVFSVVSPIEGSCAVNNATLRVIIRNFGRDTVPNVNVTANLSGMITQTLNATYTGPIFPEDADTVTFLTPINLSGGGILNISCFTGTANDVFPSNNQFDTTRTIEITPAAPATTNGSRCGSGSVTLSATAGTQIYWYNASTGGALMGGGTPFNTPSISSTTVFYAQAGLNCPSSRTPATATVFAMPVTPVTAGAARCGAGRVDLTATSTDSITWWTTSTGGVQVGSGSTYQTPNLAVTTTYFAQSSNTNCTSPRVAAVATINAIPNTPSVSSAARCGTGTLTLNATSSLPVTWWDASSGGTQVGSGNSFTTPSLSSTTSYYAQVNDGTCNSIRATATATVNSNPSVNLGQDTIYATGSYTLNAGTGFSAYSWSNGSTQQSITVTSTGNYCVTVTDGNTCTGSDCSYVDFGTGTNNLSIDRLKVYPNPSQDYFLVEGESLSDITRLTLFSPTGQIVRDINNIESRVVRIETTDLASGIYLLRCESMNGGLSIRIIVE